MSPPGGGNNPVDPRFMSLFSTFNITFPADQSIHTIYTTILNKCLEAYPTEMSSFSTKITTITLSLLEQIKERLPRTPVKFHYIFNLRDLSRIYQGICQLTLDKFPQQSIIIQ